MKLLAIDTATEACSAALQVADSVSERYELAPRRHAERILPMVHELLAEAGLQLTDLDAIAFGRGPGAFTGVRIGIGVAQGLAFGADLPVLPVSTLAALAQGAAGLNPRLLCAIDARMGEIYWCPYSITDGIAGADSDERVDKPEDVTVSGESPVYGVGSGWATYREQLQSLLGPRCLGSDGGRFPRASDMLTLARVDYQAGRALPAEQAAPVYLRDKVTG